MGLTKFTNGIGFLKKGGTGGASTTVNPLGLSPNLWYDCPLLGMDNHFTPGIADGDDFAKAMATGFPYLITGANGTFPASVASPYGVRTLTTGGSDNDECYVTTNNNVAGLIKTGPDKPWWFEARVKASQITTAQGVFVGFVGEGLVGADFMTDDTMALKVQHLLGFQIIAATDIAAVWQTVQVKSSGARVAVSATALTAAVQYVKLGMKYIPNGAGTDGSVYFFIDGAPHATATTYGSTNFPIGIVMQIVFATKAGTGAANTLAVDWWKAAQLR